MPLIERLRGFDDGRRWFVAACRPLFGIESLLLSCLCHDTQYGAAKVAFIRQKRFCDPIG